MKSENLTSVVKKYENVEEMLKGCQKGSFFKVITLTSPSMKKRNNPYYGKVQKITIYKGCMLGVSYQNVVQNAAKRNGVENDTPYIVNTNTGKGTWILGLENYITENEKGDKYLHLFITRGTRKEMKYLYEGVIIDFNNPIFDKIASWDKNFGKKHEVCKKQEDYGASDDTILSVITPKLENVIEVEQKNKIYQKSNIE